MNLIDVIVLPNYLSDMSHIDYPFIAQDIHPMNKVENNSRLEYKEEYVKVSLTLKNYFISKLECVSGIILNANIINFHINENRKAFFNNDGTVTITHKKY